MSSLSLVEKDSIATTRDSFKDCILACKIRNQIHTNFEKGKVPQAVSCDFDQKWLFCETSVLYNICSLTVALKNTFEVGHLVLVFFKENSHSHRKFTDRLFLFQLLYTKFFEPVFFRTPISGW